MARLPLVLALFSCSQLLWVGLAVALQGGGGGSQKLRALQQQQSEGSGSWAGAELEEAERSENDGGGELVDEPAGGGPICGCAAAAPGPTGCCPAATPGCLGCRQCCTGEEFCADNPASPSCGGGEAGAAVGAGGQPVSRAILLSGDVAAIAVRPPPALRPAARRLS